MSWNNMVVTRRTLAALAAGAALPVKAQESDRPLKLVVNVGLQSLDPIAGGSYVTRNFAYMVFDTLVAIDSTGAYKPQMLEGWQTSSDRLTWTFTLRPGLEFHDGSPVLAEDAVASVHRWSMRDAIGKRLAAATKAMRTVDNSTFVIELLRPFSDMIEALGKPSVFVPFIMPARLAATPPTTNVSEVMGSGPFLFNAKEWVPGERATFQRNPRYRPRLEPADGLAGGKVARVERAEIITMTDIGLRAAAIQRGEVDYLEYAPFDYISTFATDPNVVLARAGGRALIMGTMLMNHAQPPFDNVLVRRAVQETMDRTEILAALGLPADAVQPECTSLFMCGTTYSAEATSETVRRPSMDRAKALLHEAGYTNQRVVVLLPSDSALIYPIGLVMIDRMKQAGFNIDVQTSDWSSIATRLPRKGPLDQGGWSMVPEIYLGFDMAEPIGNPGIGYNCSGEAMHGAYCSAEMNPLIEEFETEPDLGKRQDIAARLQALCYENVNFPIAGQFRAPAVWRRELKGVIDFGIPILWNIQRT
jgi:peptide/nickel transport system substrate-binding protein